MCEFICQFILTAPLSLFLSLEFVDGVLVTVWQIAASNFSDPLASQSLYIYNR